MYISDIGILYYIEAGAAVLLRTHGKWTIVSLAVASIHILHEHIRCVLRLTSVHLQGGETSLACLKKFFAVGYLGVSEFVNGARQLFRVLAPQSRFQPQG